MQVYVLFNLRSLWECRHGWKKNSLGRLLKPSNPYGASKAATDLYLQERFDNKFIKGFITRAFSQGPRREKTSLYLQMHIRLPK